MKEVYRILDANFNRAREALRVAEDCGRFALNDPAITAMAKNLRSDLQEILAAMPVAEFVVSRDTPGDIGTELTSPTEAKRQGLADVATAACKRLTESLRTVEEYGKLVAPAQTLRIERMRYDAYTLEQRLCGRLLVGRKFAEVKLFMLISCWMIFERNKKLGSVLATARAAVAGGVDAIQLREKTPNINDDQFLALAAEPRELTDETGKILIINDRPDIAAIVGADGVHLGQHDLPIAESRRLLRPGAIVGRSTHSLAQARAAVQEGADYIGLGPMFDTDTKDAGPIVGPELLKQVTAEVSLPIAAVGGINVANVGQIVQTGGKCVAVCSALCQSASYQDIKTAAQAIKVQMTSEE